MDQLLDVSATHASLADASQARAQAEWLEWATMVELADAEEAEVRASEVSGPLKLARLSVIPGRIGQTIHWSDAQVFHLVAKARRVRDCTPHVWEAFRDGRVDGAKVREIASAIERLERPESIERLNRQVVAFGERHVLHELRRWLKVFVARIEADLFKERADRALAERSVDVVHGDDGVGFFTASHGSHVLAAIEKRLTKEARALGADDPRTLAQRKADLFATWMTIGEGSEPAMSADVAVTITASTLAGTDILPAVAADARWAVPAEWILTLAVHDGNNLFWHRMLVDPITDDVLAHEYKGRFAPAVLAKALEFRDGVCQAPGCSLPAHECDIDHRIPHEAGGPTAAWNTGPYCRRNHKEKGFGLIDTGPTTIGPPGRSRNPSFHCVGIIDFSRAEAFLHHVLVA